MWELKKPQPVRLIVGLLAIDEDCLQKAAEALRGSYGPTDIVSPVWPFAFTRYYENEMGLTILRQFLSFKNLIDPGDLAGIKHQTNALERKLADSLGRAVPRPVNLDPGIIETSKLILASTKNFSHRIYIGQRIYAEVTLMYNKGVWTALPYTYPDYQQATYQAFFSQVREHLREQWRQTSMESAL